MNAVVAVLAVAGLSAIAWVAATIQAMRPWLAIAVPGAAAIVFLFGLVARVFTWARSPVPFRIPTTAGQQRSLPWIRHNTFDNPSTTAGVVGRMALEVLLFRSLWRSAAGPEAAFQASAGKRAGASRTYSLPQLRLMSSRTLWLGAIAFHYSLLAIVLRHLRFFLEPVPGVVSFIATLDGFFQVGTPVLYLTDVTLAAALLYLLGRRLLDVRVRYISLVTDYFAVLLLLAIASTGIVMRYFVREDLVAIKQLALGLVTASPDSRIAASAGVLFFVHLFLVSALLAYFPFSKLVHMGGIFLSPTRNLANNNRAKRHVNEWDYAVKVHTYEEWEEEFREKMTAAGLPCESVRRSPTESDGARRSHEANGADANV